MARHELKVWPGFFQAIKDGRKTFEVRKNDRDYQLGDVLRLREYEPGPDRYTGREWERRVSYIMYGDDVLGFAFGIKTGFVVMGLESIA